MQSMGKRDSLQFSLDLDIVKTDTLLHILVDF